MLFFIAIGRGLSTGLYKIAAPQWNTPVWPFSSTIVNFEYDLLLLWSVFVLNCFL